MKTIVFLTIVISLMIVPDYTHSLIPFKMLKIINESLSKPEERMMQGNLAGDSQFPFMVCLLVYVDTGDGPYFCSASLVHRSKVLTAAQCVVKDVNTGNVMIAGGKADLMQYVLARLKTGFPKRPKENYYGAQERRVSAIRMHPGFDMNSLANNIAILVLRQRFSPGKARPISLSRSRMVNSMKCTIIGWSLTTDPSSMFKLHYVDDREVLTKNSGCEPRSGVEFLCLPPDNVTGVCLGNTGGPLVCSGMVWGLSAFDKKLEEGNKESCTLTDTILYSEVYSAVDWIESISGVNPLPVVTLKNILLLSIFSSIYEKFLVIL